MFNDFVYHGVHPLIKNAHTDTSEKELQLFCSIFIDVTSVALNLAIK